MANRHLYPFGLNKQQKMAADYYRKDKYLNKTAAYRKAYPNCSDKSLNAAASQLFSLPKVKDYLASFEAELTRKVSISQEGIIEDLIDMKEMALGNKAMPIVKITKDGEVIAVNAKQFDGAAAGKALELLGKHKKMFSDKVQVDGQLIVNLHMDLSGNHRPSVVIDQEPEKLEKTDP